MRFIYSKQSINFKYTQINNLYTLNNYAIFKKNVLSCYCIVLALYCDFIVFVWLYFFKVSLGKCLLGFRQINAFVSNNNLNSMPIHQFQEQKLQNGFENSLVVRATCLFGENFHNPWNLTLNWSLKEQIIWQLIQLIKLIPSP